MRDGYEKFVEAGIKLYAISYDDSEAVSAFAENQAIPYPLLADVDSRVIRDFGVLNDSIDPSDAMLYGMPYPGVFVCDGEGVVTGKIFHESYKMRDSAEVLVDLCLGRAQLDDPAWIETRDDDEVTVTAAVQGGTGSLRQGIVRHLVIRFELAEGLHVYAEPAPGGMVPLAITLDGPPGLVFDAPRLPETKPLHLSSMNVDLEVWDTSFDVQVPFYAVGELQSETRPLDRESAVLAVELRFQACDDSICLLPRREAFEIELPLEVIDVPNIPVHTGHGQREGGFDGMPHLRRLIARKSGNG